MRFKSSKAWKSAYNQEWIKATLPLPERSHILRSGSKMKQSFCDPSELEFHECKFMADYRKIYNLTKGQCCQLNSKRKPMSKQLTWEYVKSLAKEQDYHCPLTGVYMDPWQKYAVRDPSRPSMDRIDNALGYRIGNVRWVTLWANIARNIYPDEQFYELCTKAVQHKDKLFILSNQQIKR